MRNLGGLGAAAGLALGCLMLAPVWAAEGVAAAREGAFVEKWPGEVTKIEGFYKEGELNGPYCEYFESGRIKIRTAYAKGKLQGAYQEFFDDGKNYIQCNYANGLKEGAYQEFAAGGKLKIRCGYAEGLLHGSYAEFTADGKSVAKEAFYIYGAERFLRAKKTIDTELAKIQADTLKAANLPAPVPAPASGAALPANGGTSSGTGGGGGRGGKGKGGDGGGARGGMGTGAGAPTAAPVSQASPAAVADGLIQLKQARMIAGVPYADITLKESYAVEAQAAADLLAELGELNHNPPQPAGMSDEKYRLAFAGCQHGNLAMGSKSLSEAVMRWMYDSDDNNKDTVGHRRWNLNPAMLQTGFGQNGKFLTIWAHDTARAEIPEFTAIPWPAAGYHPVGFFGPRWCWSVSLNPDKFQMPAVKDLKVSLWVLDKNYRKSGKPLELDHLVVNTDPYGVRYAVIFRPKTVSVSAGSALLVEIEGLKDSAGEPVRYNVVTEFY